MSEKKAVRRSSNRGRPEHGQEAGIPAAALSFEWTSALPCVLLVVATLAAYQPAWSGGLLWDDAQHLTSPALQSIDGLRRIWYELGATQQYYPVTHSVFWLQHRLWGDATLGYHLVTIVLHTISALLVAAILRRLRVPGAMLAAVIFALHPVNVESVAWITELKNTLSGVFCLGSFLAYLDFHRTRRTPVYAVALALFLLALLSKTVTAMLPAVIIVAWWWRRESIGMRRDLLPLAPFFALAAIAGILTAWVERELIGAQGAEFQFGILERCVIAGRAVWFYLGKLAWPADLMFVYPRWTIVLADWRQSLYPLGVVTLFLVLWTIRGRSRAPLAAMLVFCATLFPVLGFFNVFPFRYSFVADHFAYLASIPIAALFAAGMTTLVTRFAGSARRWHAAGVATVGALLAVITWHVSARYADATTLYETTLRDNPACWLAHVNLGVMDRDAPAPDLGAAARHFREALRLQPNATEAHYDLALTLQKMGRLPEAVREYREAVRLEPRLAPAQGNLCNVLNATGQLAEAKVACEAALALRPDAWQPHDGLARTLLSMGRTEQALEQCREAERLAPDRAEVRYRAGTVLQTMGRLAEASKEYREALRLKPEYPEAVNNLGFVFQQMGRTDDALSCFREALRLKPDYVDAHYYLGNAMQSLGRLEEAAEQYQTALAISPADAAIHNNLGLALEGLGRTGEASGHYEEAARLRPDLAQARENLARVVARRRIPR